MRDAPLQDSLESASPPKLGWLRNYAGFMVVFAAVVGVVVNTVLLLQIGTPFGGYFSWVEPGDGWGLPSQYTPDWWPINAFYPDPARLWLRTADGQEYAYHVEAAFADAAAAGRPTVRIEADAPGGNLLNLDLPVLRFSLRDFIDIRLPELIIGAAFFLLAIIVLRARPESPLNRSFAVIACIVAAHRWVQAPAVYDGVGWYAIIVLDIGTALAAFTGPAAVHFALEFPTPKRKLIWTLMPFLYSAAAGLTFIYTVTRTPLSPVQGPELAAFTRALFPVTLVMYLGGVLALLIRLTWSWIYERRTRRQRRSAAIVLAGMIAALPMLLVMAAPIIPGLGGGTDSFVEGLDLRYMLLGVALAFAYVILRYQTFQSPSGLFVLVFALSFSALLAAVLSWAWLHTPHNEATELTRPPFAVLFTGTLLVSLFWIAAGRGRGWFGRFWNWERHSYDAARSFGRRVMADTDLRRLPSTIAEALVEELELEQAAVWLWRAVPTVLPPVDGEAGAFVLSATAGVVTGPATPRIALPAGHPPLATAQRLTPDGSTPLSLQPLAQAGYEVVVPLVAEERPIGLLGLGRRWDEEIFDDRDLAVADLVGQQATLFVLAAQQVEELRRVPVRLAEAQERERLNLARELHDTTQQFLGRLPFYLAVSRSMIFKEPQRAAEVLDSSMDDAQEAATLLRNIRINLAPTMLETSLLHPLQGLVAHVQQRSGVVVQLDAPDDLDARTTIDTRQALYRVIQQAMDNAVAHAQASEIGVTLAAPDGKVSFEVHDNGVGIEPGQLEAAAARGSFGFVSMKTRIESVGGGFTLDSAPGQGTTIGGWVPGSMG